MMDTPIKEALLAGLRPSPYEQAIEALEHERLRLAACGVVALSNTPESAAKARDMHPAYRSGSCDDVARIVDQNIAMRAELEAAREVLRRIDILGPDGDGLIWLQLICEGRSGAVNLGAVMPFVAQVMMGWKRHRDIALAAAPAEPPHTAAEAIARDWVYEDTLPQDMDYDAWYEQSAVVEGVRMGPA